MRREKQEHLVTTGVIKRKQREKMLDGLIKWRKVRRATEALKATRDKDTVRGRS